MIDLGIFRNGVLVERVAPDMTLSGNNGYWRGREQTARAYARVRELDGRHEVLRICPNHPERSVVDCADCDPDDA